jgi:hypothetical protein
MARQQDRRQGQCTEIIGASFVPVVWGQGMKRLILVIGLALAAVLLVPSVAAADKPLREGLPAEDFTIEGSCAFDVDLHILVNRRSPASSRPRAAAGRSSSASH